MIAFLLAGAAAASAGPAYLRCPFPRAEILITADEANSSVTVTVPSTGHTEKLPAAFTSTDVRFSNNMLSYVISRTDLSISRTITMIKSEDHTTCVVETPPKRAF